MTLKERIDGDLTEAMKSRDEARLSTLRLLRSELKNREIEKRSPLNDEDIQGAIRTMVKQYKDALESFVASGRADLEEKQRREITVLEAYLPAELSDEEITAIVEGVVLELNAAPGDFGVAMGAAMKKVAGRADGNRVRDIVKKVLQ